MLKNDKRKRKKIPEREDFIERIDYDEKIPLSDLVTDLEVSFIGGNIVIIGTEDIPFAQIKMQWLAAQECLPRVRLAGCKLEITAHSFRPFLKQKNAFIIEIYVPRHLQTSIRCLGASIWLERLDKAVRVKMGAGSLEGHTLQNIDVRTAAGSINIYNLKGNTTVKVGIGDAHLSWQDLKKDSSVKVKVGLGDVSLEFPKSVGIRSEKSIRAGAIPNEIGASVFATVGLGDIKVD